MLGAMFVWFFYVYHQSQYWADTTPPKTNLASSLPTGQLSLEMQEEIIREDHRFLNLLKKKVEGHELALRRQDQDRKDFESLLNM